MPKTKTLSKPKSGKAKKTLRRTRKGGLSLFGPKKVLTAMEQKEENLKKDIKLIERYIKEKKNQISSLTRRYRIAHHKQGQRKGRLGILRDLNGIPPRIEALQKDITLRETTLEQKVYKLRTLEEAAREAARVEAEAARVKAEAARVEAEAAAAKAAEEAAPCPRCTDGTTANQCSDVVKALEERLAQAKADLQAAVDREDAAPPGTKSSHSSVREPSAQPLSFVADEDSKLAGWDQSRH